MQVKGRLQDFQKILKDGDRHVAPQEGMVPPAVCEGMPPFDLFYPLHLDGLRPRASCSLSTRAAAPLQSRMLQPPKALKQTELPPLLLRYSYTHACTIR